MKNNVTMHSLQQAYTSYSKWAKVFERPLKIS